MRSVIHSSFGNPAEVLQVAERPTPIPGAGQVRIKSTLSPIHNHDLWTIRGQYGYKPQLPAIGGSEVAGVIDAIGEGVERVKPGQRVVVAGIHEAWADYVLAPAAAVIPLPDAISDETGCQLIAMPLSAVMLLEYLHLEPGQWFIQNTANGAVGKTLAMLANARGINVVNLVRREAGIAELIELGIGNAVSTDSEGWKERVRGIVGDAPLAAGVDSVGGDASGDIFGLLGENGTLVSFGAMSGQPMRLNSGDAIFKQATVKGFWASKISEVTSGADKARMIGELLTLAVSGELKLPVEAVFDIGNASQAAAASEKSARKGKVLLRF
ncbi:zinc-binding dehydrogenase [Paraburkholderia domus]|uniref:enoyl-[acyl-carrier-protein] reductase n=1 Tax=Paraburkholderia domus TaxID=2793075 RepID=A0A9N8QSX8_9BURK|nr:zinc-binding dehydrogenase [Paraburkholderia domus]MBK5051058.1 zinc-binding dehydrogenase [Burkholderia sp. R-70006]MBK5064998.1 zinc-binding dehydrogenase [Burkholderia sp. R-70199]MBK5118636.1 zinc-binding dehydrogenase [Burkholderia sp. R-69980]MBK5164474.1 zinc-binding dehydrogenase [Burkholderia sp. R-70211]MCI0144656.1 zinc-binding dehydrogenase [Paraburkholderia sediminicola]